MEDYLKFINTDLSDKKVSAFLGNDNSIFTKNKSIDQSIKLPSNMDPAIFR